MLVLMLASGDIVIMDNLIAYKVAGVCEAMSAARLQRRSQSDRTGIYPAQRRTPGTRVTNWLGDLETNLARQTEALSRA
jgi:hypothetical protein